MTLEEIKWSGLPKTLIKPLQKIADKIDMISNESGGRYSDGYWIYPIKGYTFDVCDCHVAHEYTVKDLILKIKNLEICKCKDCITYED